MRYFLDRRNSHIRKHKWTESETRVGRIRQRFSRKHPQQVQRRRKKRRLGRRSVNQAKSGNIFFLLPTNVIRQIWKKTKDFFPSDQFLGLSGSRAPCHSTRLSGFSAAAFSLGSGFRVMLCVLVLGGLMLWLECGKYWMRRIEPGLSSA